MTFWGADHSSVAKAYHKS